MRQNRCVPVSDQCRTFNDDGICTACYKGYELSDSGECLLSRINVNPPSDPGCAEWDWDNQICLRCAPRWIMGSNGCLPISDFCRTHNDDG